MDGWMDDVCENDGWSDDMVVSTPVASRVVVAAMGLTTANSGDVAKSSRALAASYDRSAL